MVPPAEIREAIESSSSVAPFQNERKRSIFEHSRDAALSQLVFTGLVHGTLGLMKKPDLLPMSYPHASVKKRGLVSKGDGPRLAGCKPAMKTWICSDWPQTCRIQTRKMATRPADSSEPRRGRYFPNLRTRHISCVDTVSGVLPKRVAAVRP